MYGGQATGTEGEPVEGKAFIGSQSRLSTTTPVVPTVLSENKRVTQPIFTRGTFVSLSHTWPDLIGVINQGRKVCGLVRTRKNGDMSFWTQNKE